MTSTAPVSIARRFCGPPTSGNGGVSAGLLATVLGAGIGDAVEVRLHNMPPLETPLVANEEDGTTRLLDGDTVIVSGRVVEWPGAMDVGTDRPAATWDEAVAAGEAPFDDSGHPYPTCFVCGPDRAAHDGLRLFARPVAGRAADDAVSAACWIPDDTVADPDEPTVVRPEIVWGALDCPGGQALHVFGGEEVAVLLGGIVARRLAPVRIGGRYVATSWERLPRDGRKNHSTTVLTDADTGEVVGESLALWISVPATR